VELGKKIGAALGSGDVVALEAPLAAGKTVLAQGIAAALGVRERVTSPTFTIVSEYQGKIPLYHIDVYRLDTEDDFRNIGGEELLAGQGVCVVEWSEKIASLLDGAIRVKIRVEADGARKITVDAPRLEGRLP
jgi:tRNA threonylcarbamoyladenosine biosynthesis protein TsaE